MQHQIARRDAGPEQSQQQAQRERRAEMHYRSSRRTGDHFRVRHAIGQRRNRETKSYEGTRNAHVEKSAARGDRRANAYECAERADQRGRRNEIRIAGVNAVSAAGEKVTQLVREQDAQQRECEWNSRRKETGMAEQLQIQRKKIVEVGIAACGVSARELRADGKRRKQREQKKQKRDGKLFAALGAAADLKILRG